MNPFLLKAGLIAGSTILVGVVIGGSVGLKQYLENKKNKDNLTNTISSGEKTISIQPNIIQTSENKLTTDLDIISKDNNDNSVFVYDEKEIRLISEAEKKLIHKLDELQKKSEIKTEFEQDINEKLQNAQLDLIKLEDEVRTKKELYDTANSAYQNRLKELNNKKEELDVLTAFKDNAIWEDVNKFKTEEQALLEEFYFKQGNNWGKARHTLNIRIDKLTKEIDDIKNSLEMKESEAAKDQTFKNLEASEGAKKRKLEAINSLKVQKKNGIDIEWLCNHGYMTTEESAIYRGIIMRGPCSFIQSSDDDSDFSSSSEDF